MIVYVVYNYLFFLIWYNGKCNNEIVIKMFFLRMEFLVYYFNENDDIFYEEVIFKIFDEEVIKFIFVK